MKDYFKNNKYSIVAGNTNHYAKRAIDASEIKLIDLNKLYKINLLFSNCSFLADGSVNLGFDNLGRPFIGDLNNRVNFYDYVLKDSCIIHLTKKSDSIDIYIEPETDYVHIK